MESEELFYPEISVAIGSYALQKGVEVEVYSDQNSYFDWAKIRFTPQFQENISVKKKEPGTVMLGYNRVLDTVFEGYVTGPYSGGGYMDEIVLKDKMLLLEETTISNTFLDVTPQEIISYCLAQAGVTETKLSAEIYQPRSVVSIAQKNVIAVIKEINTIWGIKNKFFFSGGIFYWGEKPEQEKIYNFEYGVNIITLDKPLGSWELETVSAPFVKHSHKINITHPKISGEFEVQKVIFRTNENGFIRTYINF